MKKVSYFEIILIVLNFLKAHDHSKKKKKKKTFKKTMKGEEIEDF